MTDPLPPTIRQRLEKIISNVPGPALKDFVGWLEEVVQEEGYGTCTFTAKRGEILPKVERLRT
jgi:hypothetical protein